MSILSDIKKNQRFFVAATIVLFFSMTLNIMGVVGTKFFYDGNAGTESLFGNQIVCGGDAYGGFLLKNWEEKVEDRQLEVCADEEIRPYESTFNLAGRLYGYPYSALSNFIDVNPSMYIKLAQVSSALLVAIVLSVFLVWVRSNYGNTVSIITLLLTASSPQLMTNSATMIAHYNVFCFILLVYCLYYYKPEASRKYRTYFWVTLTAIFCLKALTSYEYITTYAAMVAAIVGYCLWIQKASLKSYAKEFLLVALFCFLGLLAALSIHIGTLAIQKGSVGEATVSIRKALMSRTVGARGVNPYRDMRWTAPEAFNIINVYTDMEKREEARDFKGSNINLKDQIVDSVVSFVNYLMLPVVSIPIALKQPLAAYVQSFAFLLLSLAVAWKFRNDWVKGKVLNRKVGALYVALAISFLGYLSWQVLARNHSLIHPHINGYTMYIPFALFGYVIIGLLVDSGLRKMKLTKR